MAAKARLVYNVTIRLSEDESSLKAGLTSRWAPTFKYLADSRTE